MIILQRLTFRDLQETTIKRKPNKKSCTKIVVFQQMMILLKHDIYKEIRDASEVFSTLAIAQLFQTRD
jgi:hypothetical protein